MYTKSLKYRDETWDLQNVDTKEYTHCFHTYPAMMIPQIARKLIKTYGVEGGWLLDPYCGTGTSLVEASLFGMHSVGCDINPLVRLIAIAKSTEICLSTLDETLSRLNDHLFQVEFQKDKVPGAPIPEIPNLAYWFSEEVIRYLAYLRAWINKVEDEAVRNFILVAFSEMVREVSYTRNGEFKLYRMPTQKLEGFKPDIFGIFSKKLSRNRHGLAAFLEKRKNVEVSVSSANTVDGELPMPRPLGDYDVVITSPPYGDSQTTVAYGQYSRLAAEWIGLPNARKIDKLAMGGQHSKKILKDSPISPAIDKIRFVDEKRAREVSAFYIDLRCNINSIVQVLSRQATICYVVGNRRVKEVMLPTDEFIVDAFRQHGFTHKATIVRNIPNKRMPKKNSPSNVAGETSTTMHEENIVICQRTTHT
ncbi:DNA methyltransferase [Candidatus Poribacteria bacterium]|nr:DNA methyltransferase [Candidatus Poribacteria bacterium]MYH79261.1 DNA methyltransferase [Candidatus Poribacteria bacterium]MYK95752.1 DNA methyltransferase [Candidatus Poribacteria bacterium]